MNITCIVLNFKIHAQPIIEMEKRKFIIFKNNVLLLSILNNQHLLENLCDEDEHIFVKRLNLLNQIYLQEDL
ncbi:hypothetical protein CWI37_1804p0010 [Hamiltosporidium tvaerminnensis]|uniref:Uncharacterized protein n=1 Tax=Hamiltosporidium tvaerminnensis TaxID=1176355 RepID=A0A4Q9KUR2_9MICR|nr:hypothetical protein CWI37_1804p0010 [Hamiltosporidium tvaerminnensis]